MKLSKPSSKPLCNCTLGKSVPLVIDDMGGASVLVSTNTILVPGIWQQYFRFDWLFCFWCYFFPFFQEKFLKFSCNKWFLCLALQLWKDKNQNWLFSTWKPSWELKDTKSKRKLYLRIFEQIIFFVQRQDFTSNFQDGTPPFSFLPITFFWR